MGHHLGVFTVTCNRKSFCFAYNGRASSEELRHSLSRFSSKLQGTKEIIQVPELSPKTAAFTFFLLLTSSLWSKCTFSRLIIPFILCRYERKMCSTDECTVFKIQQKSLILPIRKTLTLAEISFHSRNFGMKIQMRHFGLIFKHC